jgi:hypothetical protein
MYPESLHQVRIPGGIEVVTPLQRSVFRSDYRVPESFINAVPFQGEVLPAQQFFVLAPKEGFSFFVIHIIDLQ